MIRVKQQVGDNDCKSCCCTLKVHCVDCNGAAVPGCTVEAVRAGHTGVIAYADSGGLARLPLKASGTYAVQLSAPNSWLSSTNVDVACPAGLELTLSLGLPRLQVLAAGGCRNTGVDLTGITITATSPGKPDQTIVPTGVPLFYLPGTGTWTVTVTGVPRWVDPAPVTVNVASCGGFYNANPRFTTPAAGYHCGGCPSPFPETLHCDIGDGPFDLAYTNDPGGTGVGYWEGFTTTAGGTIGLAVRFTGSGLQVATNYVNSGTLVTPLASTTPDPFGQFNAALTAGGVLSGFSSCLPMAFSAPIVHPGYSNLPGFGGGPGVPISGGAGGWYTGTIHVYE